MSYSKMNREITSYLLRIIALSTMFVDHLAACVLLPMIKAGMVSSSYSVVYMLMRYVGRLAFPLFCFFLAQGMVYSRSKEKYMFRLLLLAIVSEPIYDYTCRSGIVDMKYQNVIWELLFGAFIIYVLQKLGIVANPLTGKKESVCSALRKGVSLVIAIGVISVALVIASLLNFDYAIAGILLILCLYLLRDKKKLCVAVGAMILFVGTFLDTLITGDVTGDILQGAFDSAVVEMFGVFSLMLTVYYSGVRGRNMPKWISYGFYPLHLLLLTVIRTLIMMKL